MPMVAAGAVSIGAPPAAAESGAVNLHLEPGVALMLGEPQTSLFGVGGGLALRADCPIAGPLAAQLSLLALGFPGESGSTSGRVLAAGAGLRARLLDDRAGYAGRLWGTPTPGGGLLGNVWVDANAYVAGTGPLTRFAFDAGLGAEVSVADGLQLGPFVRYAQVVQSGRDAQVNPADALMVLLGVSATVGFVDREAWAHGDPDRDGILGAADACPSEPEDPDGFQDDDGCPDADNDGDTLADGDDRCPDAAGPVHNGGCPDRDRDGDGLVDRIDFCPDEPGTPANKGCAGPDRDGDGLIDRLDECPDTPGAAQHGGCPEPDRDGDGFVDRIDACPDQAEVFNGHDDDDGCPDEGAALAVLTSDRIEIRQTVAFDEEKVRFGTALWKVSPDSYLMLATVAKILFLHPEILRVRIEGHTDDVGSREYNLALSRRRAEAVREHLVEVNGIEPERLEVAGFAFDRPIAPNDTEEGRARNRRVEFHIVERATWTQPASSAPQN